MLAYQCFKVEPQKCHERFVRKFREPTVGELGHFGVVLALRMRVGETAAGVTADVAVERRADVPKFVQDRHQLFLKRQLELLLLSRFRAWTLPNLQAFWPIINCRKTRSREK